MAAFLQWTQWLFLRALAGAPCVVVNVDETAVERLVPHRRGHVLPSQPDRAAVAGLYERIARRDSHGHVTLVGAVASDPALQSHLPQLVLARDGTLSVAERTRLRALRAPLQWLEGTDGWVTGANFPRVLTLLRRAILAQRPGSQVVVVCDSAAQHVCDAAVLHAQRLRIHLVCIPGRVTWLLQPLDTHVFALLKRRLHTTQLVERAASATGVLGPTRWIHILEAVVTDVLVRGDWSRAMHANGLCGNTGALRPRICQALQGQLPLPLVAPSDEELTTILGRRRQGLAERLTRGAERFRRAAAAAALPWPDAAV